MKKIVFFIIILAFAHGDLDGQKLITEENANISISIPFQASANSIKPLMSLADQDLQNQLSKMVEADPKLNRLVTHKKMAIGLVLLNDTSNVRFARLNGSVEMYAASLPKIAILLAAMDALEKKEIQDNAKLREDMHLMIARSDNDAATRVMDLLGFEKIESVLTDPRYRLYDEEYGGGLWVGKRYAKTGRRYPDPLNGISHAATVTQVCRYYYMLVYGQLVSYERSKEMLAIMKDPELHHKFVNSLNIVAPKANLFRKSGSWHDYHSDSILVWGAERKYILVALTEDPDGEKILRQLVFKIEELLKNQS